VSIVVDAPSSRISWLALGKCLLIPESICPTDAALLFLLFFVVMIYPSGE
jgi:hypothetical protein